MAVSISQTIKKKKTIRSFTRIAYYECNSKISTKYCIWLFLPCDNKRAGAPIQFLRMHFFVGVQQTIKIPDCQFCPNALRTEKRIECAVRSYIITTQESKAITLFPNDDGIFIFCAALRTHQNVLENISQFRWIPHFLHK